MIILICERKSFALLLSMKGCINAGILCERKRSKLLLSMKGRSGIYYTLWKEDLDAAIICRKWSFWQNLRCQGRGMRGKGELKRRGKRRGNLETVLTEIIQFGTNLRMATLPPFTLHPGFPGFLFLPSAEVQRTPPLSNFPTTLYCPC